MSHPEPIRAVGPASPRRVAKDEHRVLLVRLGVERFAFPLAELLEAVDAPEVVPVALAAAGLVGQCAYRGRLLPVFDGAGLLGAERTEGPGALLVSEGPSGRFGILVDDVEDMVFAPRNSWRSLPGGGGGSASSLRALLALEDGIAALVDVPAVRAIVAARLRPVAR